jgi:hypothetical protein
MGEGAKSERTVAFKWDRRQTSHSDESIIQALRRFGDIESVKLKASSAKVVFADKRAAVRPHTRIRPVVPLRLTDDSFVS